MFFDRSLVVESCGLGADETCESFKTTIPGAISRHWLLMPLGADTQTQTHTYTYTDVQTKAIFGRTHLV